MTDVLASELPVPPRAPQLSLADTAIRIAHANDPDKLKWFFEFCRGMGDPEVDIAALIERRPATTGDLRFDTLLAAAAEHYAFHGGVDTPQWCSDDIYYLQTPWWIPGTRQANVWAFVYAPAAFRVRGIFIERRDLANV